MNKFLIFLTILGFATSLPTKSQQENSEISYTILEGRECEETQENLVLKSYSDIPNVYDFIPPYEDLAGVANGLWLAHSQGNYQSSGTLQKDSCMRFWSASGPIKSIRRIGDPNDPRPSVTFFNDYNYGKQTKVMYEDVPIFLQSWLGFIVVGDTPITAYSQSLYGGEDSVCLTPSNGYYGVGQARYLWCDYMNPFCFKNIGSFKFGCD